MKKIFLLFGVALLLAACSKKADNNPQTNNGDYYLSFKMNDTVRTFTQKSSAQFVTPSKVRQASLYGVVGATAKDLILTVVDTAVIVANRAYASSTQVIYTPQLGYSAATFYYKDGNGQQYSASYEIPNTLVTITFITIDQKYVKGTFSAKVALVNTKPVRYANITDGKFYISRDF